jgi:flavin-dependent dehydrogenase
VLDLLVAGGGPVGFATALYAARAGLTVAVVEPRTGAIDKACGEGLMPGAVEALTDVGVGLDGRPLRGIRYTDGRHVAEAEFVSGTGCGVRRTALHAALRAAVAKAGVPVLARAVQRVEQDATGVAAAGLRARYLAAADGLHSPVRRQLGIDAIGGTRRDRPDGAQPLSRWAPLGGRQVPGSRRQPASSRRASLPGGRVPLPRYGLRRHYAVAPWADFVEVHWGPDLEAYVTPVASDLVGVALLTSHRAPFARQLEQFPALLDRLPEQAVTSTKGAGPLLQCSTTRVAGRVMLVGDAAGYVDALTGEGISVGMAGARALVECVAADRPNDYERRWLSATRRYRWLTSSLLAARAHRRTAGLIVPAAERLPRVFRAAVNSLAR